MRIRVLGTVRLVLPDSHEVVSRLGQIWLANVHKWQQIFWSFRGWDTVLGGRVTSSGKCLPCDKYAIKLNADCLHLLKKYLFHTNLLCFGFVALV